MNDNQVYQLASDFRRALETISAKGLYGRLSIFRSFPKGCCGYTSDLLASYLIENGIQPDRLQVAKSETNKQQYTHSWVVIDHTLCVDITADQFNTNIYFRKYQPIPSCLIVPLGTDLYECFESNKTHFSHNIGIDSYSEYISIKLQELYNIAVTLCKKS